jgi:hypothetical protein
MQRAVPMFNAVFMSMPINVAAWCKPQLALASEQHVPRLMFVLAD